MRLFFKYRNANRLIRFILNFHVQGFSLCRVSFMLLAITNVYDVVSHQDGPTRSRMRSLAHLMSSGSQFIWSSIMQKITAKSWPRHLQRSTWSPTLVPSSRLWIIAPWGATSTRQGSFLPGRHATDRTQLPIISTRSSPKLAILRCKSYFLILLI